MNTEKDDFVKAKTSTAYDHQTLDGARQVFEELATGANPAPLVFAQAIGRASRRLRDADAYNKRHSVRDPLHLEAAEEIERLTAALNEIKQFAEATRPDPQANVSAILAIADGALS